MFTEAKLYTNHVTSCRADGSLESKNETSFRQFKCRKCNSYFKDKTTYACHRSQCGTVAKSNTDPIVIGKRRPQDVDTIPKCDRFKCNICGKKCKDNYGLNRHSMACHDTNQYHCRKCWKHFSTTSEWDDHKTACNLVRNSNICTLETGNAIEDVKARYKCTECGASFPDNYKLNRHSTRIHRKVQYMCRKCGLYFDSGKQSETHRSRCTHEQVETVSDNQPVLETVSDDKKILEAVSDNQPVLEAVSDDQQNIEAVSGNQQNSKPASENDHVLENVRENQISFCIRCVLCQEEFEDEQSYSSHASQCTAKINLPPDITYEKTDDTQDPSHDMDVFKCRLCKIQFSSKPMLENHVSKAHTASSRNAEAKTQANVSDTFNCSACRQQFDSFLKQKNHACVKHKDVAPLDTNMPTESSNSCPCVLKFSIYRYS